MILLYYIFFLLHLSLEKTSSNNNKPWLVAACKNQFHFEHLFFSFFVTVTIIILKRFILCVLCTIVLLCKRIIIYFIEIEGTIFNY
jgi:hypothetical protein